MIANLRFVVAAALGAVSLFAQGSLTPPGSPAPSMKTLGQIEPRAAIEKVPFTISVPGSYYLAASLMVPKGANGIAIEASGVTLDLGGFALRGEEDCGDGISIAAGRADIAIRNGSILAVRTGIAGVGAARLSIENVRVSLCRGTGIDAGLDASVVRSAAHDNEGSGISVSHGSQVIDCQASGNFEVGIATGNDATVRGVTTLRNGWGGIATGNGATLAVVTANNNFGTGIEAGTSVQAIDCAAHWNKKDGIVVGAWSTLTRATAISNLRFGMFVADGSSVIDSAASINGWLGIQGGANMRILNCRSDAHPAGGISVRKGSLVRDCLVQRNTGDGILVTDECTAIRNTCQGNSNLRGAAGLHASGTDNVLQENNLNSNDRGLAVDLEGNLITRNSASGNSFNYVFSGDQTAGASVSSSNAADTANPLANIEF